MNLKAWAKEPLVHFLGAGALLFLIAGVFAGSEDPDGRTVTINRAELLVHLQARAQVYDGDVFAALLDNMDEAERARLVRDTALQEVLYREGQALGLAQADPLVRQRIIQQMRLLLSEEAARDLSVSEADVRVFYEAHMSDYALDLSVSFSHIFFAGDGRKVDAEQALDQVRAEQVLSDSAGQYGERFLYQLHYADAGAPMLTSHFGAAFTSRVFEAGLNGWSAPIVSDHGWHLVLLNARNLGVEPDYDAIKDKVREDALSEMRQSASARAMDLLLEKYTINLGESAQP